MNINEFIIIGKYHKIVDNDLLLKHTNDKDITSIISILIDHDVKNKMLLYCKKDDVIGIKGIINSSTNYKPILIATKVTFLVSKQKASE